MQENGIGPNQITQVRGFADQRLRKPDAPLDPSNRRISLIVQYMEKRPDTEPAASEKGESLPKPGEAALPASPTGKAVEKPSTAEPTTSVEPASNKE